MHLTLRQAEQRVRASKSTILRAIRTGKLSADRDGPEGAYRIEPSELFRVFPPVSDSSADEADRGGGGASNASVLDPVAVARLTAETEKLTALLDVERRRSDELREDRDSWRAQAERLALAHHATTANDMALAPTHEAAGRPNLLERLGRALRG